MMFKSTLIGLAALSALASGFTIPNDHPDGVYVVTTDEDGKDAHVRVGNVDRSAIPETPGMSMRSVGLMTRDWTVTCGGAKNLNNADCDAANAALDAQCGNGNIVPGNTNWYSKVGGVVAFYCNYGSGNNKCDSGSRATSSSLVTASCGKYNAGWADVKSYGLSYGYDSNDSNFCGRGH